MSITTKKSLGNNLTKGQAQFFKDSKAVDDKGNLLVLYHGTTNGGFSVFEGDRYYFSAEERAKIYSSTKNKY